MPAVGDESLAAVQDIAAVGLPRGGGLHALEVAARRGLAHRDRAHHLAAGELRQVVLLLRLGAVVQHVRRDDLAVQPEADAGVIAARELLHLDHGIQLVRSRAAVLLGHRHAKESVRARLAPDLPVDVALLLPRVVVRRDLLVDEAAEGIAERFVVGREEGARDHAVAMAFNSQNHAPERADRIAHQLAKRRIGR